MRSSGKKRGCPLPSNLPPRPLSGASSAWFKPDGIPHAKFLLAEHPEVEQPVASYAEHSAIAKITFAPDGSFGAMGKMFIAFFGHMAPMTGTVDKHGGHRVIMVDPVIFESTDFLTQKSHGHSGGMDEGKEKDSDGNTASAGPRRLLDVRFSPDGTALYAVDFGVMFVDKKGITAKPETGAVWRITSDGSETGNVSGDRKDKPNEILKDEVSVDSPDKAEEIK